MSFLKCRITFSYIIFQITLLIVIPFNILILVENFVISINVYNDDNVNYHDFYGKK